MKINQFYNSIIFRLAAPSLFGILIYLLILMFFDSVNMLAENFFSREVLFVIGLTYVFFEANRLVIVVLNITFPVSKNLKTRIVFQYIFSFVITIILISVLLTAYFKFIIGFSTIGTELITFNAIYILTTFFFHLYFFSMVYLHKQNVILIQKEEILKANTEAELQAFKNQINPSLLFQSLETIISELQINKKTADNLIEKLSQVYRYILDNKHNDLVSLNDEMISLKPMIDIFNIRYDGAFKVELNIHEEYLNLNLIPGTLQLLIEYALFQNIVSKKLPLIININCDNKEQIRISYKFNERIANTNPVEDRFCSLKKAYGYYNNSGLNTEIKNYYQIIKIPLMEIHEE